MLSFVTQLTNLHISIPASGAPPGEVPEECFPRGVLSRGMTDPRCVPFASGVTVLGDDPLLEQSLDIRIHVPVCPDVVEDDDMDSVEALLDVPVHVFQPPPPPRNVRGRGRSGDRTVTRHCLTFRGNSLAGFLGAIWGPVG